MLLCENDQSATRDAAAIGAFTVSRAELDCEVFARVLAAAAQRQAHARALWRTSLVGRETQRFGDAFIRGYRCIRRLASGATTDLYLGESERAGTLVVLKVARDRVERTGPADRCLPPLPAGIRDRTAHRKSGGGEACTTSG